MQIGAENKAKMMLIGAENRQNGANCWKSPKIELDANWSQFWKGAKLIQKKMKPPQHCFGHHKTNVCGPLEKHQGLTVFGP